MCNEVFSEAKVWKLVHSILLVVLEVDSVEDEIG